MLLIGYNAVASSNSFVVDFTATMIYNNGKNTGGQLAKKMLLLSFVVS